MSSGRYCFEDTLISVTLRPLLLEYGLWNQVRVDHGREWNLSLFVQEQLSDLRYNKEKAPHLQTPSTMVSDLHNYY